MSNRFSNYPEDLKERIDGGEIIQQSYVSFVKELNSFSEKQLDQTALVCGGRSLSYRKMFRVWDRYVQVFTALGITAESRSRIAHVADVDMESIHVFYGARITGAAVSEFLLVDVLDEKRIGLSFQKEQITDLVIDADLLKPDMLRMLSEKKKSYGIHNLIVYFPKMTPESARMPLSAPKRALHRHLRRVPGVLFMDELLDEYRDGEIFRDSSDSREAPMVFHTSGTTSGIHKPVPLSDFAFNESAARFMRDTQFSTLKRATSFISFPIAIVVSASSMMHLPFAFGGTIVLPDQTAGMFFTLKSLEENRVNVLHASGLVFKMLMDNPIPLDLSHVEMAVMGGTGESSENRQQYIRFLRSRNKKTKLLVGYGLTEVGGAALLSEPNSIEDRLGRPLPGVKIKIRKEEVGSFHELSEGPMTGVLYLSTPSLSGSRIGDEVFFTHELIDGEPYLNTCDLVDVHEDGSIQVIGRMNKYSSTTKASALMRVWWKPPFLLSREFSSAAWCPALTSSFTIPYPICMCPCQTRRRRARGWCRMH